MLDDDKDFLFNSSTNELEIRINPLFANKKYRVVVRKIRDKSGNELEELCQWDFSTGTLSSAIGNTGVCGQLSGATSAPQNLRATSGNSTVSLVWEAPLQGSPDSYKLEVSNDEINYSTVIDANNLFANQFSFDDSNVTNGTTYFYRIVAVNGIGDSPKAFSNGVTPKQITVSTELPIKLISNNPTSFSSFGFSVALSPDGLNLAVGEIAGSGLVHLFQKSGVDWLANGRLVSSTNVGGNSRFGDVVAFNPVDSSLAVANTAAIEIFDYANPSWSSTGTVLNIQAQTRSMVFSADGLTLVVGEPSAAASDTISRSGIVEVFSKSSGIWIAESKIISKTPASGNAFGYTVALSQFGNYLAVSEINNTNTVQIFKRSATSWNYIETLVSQRATITGFGSSLKFDPDSTTLAVYDALAINNFGSVQLFNLIGESWKVGQELLSQNPAEFNYFGAALSFSPDGNILVIGEYNGNTVQFFNKNNSVWNYVYEITSAVPTSSTRFGKAIAYDGTALVIGEDAGAAGNINSAGAVYVHTDPITIQ